MFCPNCGTNNSTEQNFCRSCGLNLEQISTSLLEQIPSAESAELLRYEKRVDNFGKIALGGLATVGITGLGALFYNWLSKVILAGDSLLVPLLLLGFLVFGLLSLIFVYFNESLKEKKKNRHVTTLSNKDLQQREQFELSQGDYKPVGSVTDNTTQLLPDKNKTKELV